MFWTRFSTLRGFASATKWVYPCFMLTVRYREVCVFHQTLGGLAAVCDAEFWKVMEFAINLVYGPLFASYGGVLGVASSFSYVYFPFINNLPLLLEDKASFAAFTKKYMLFSQKWNAPCAWLIGVTRASPREAN